MPCHHKLEEYLTAYIDVCGLRDDPKPLFRNVPNRGGQLTRTAMLQSDAYRIIGRRTAGDRHGYEGRQSPLTGSAARRSEEREADPNTSPTTDIRLLAFATGQKFAMQR